MRNFLKIPATVNVGGIKHRVVFTFSSGKVKQFINNRKLLSILVEDLGALNANLDHLQDIVDITDWLFACVDNDVQNRFGGQAIRLEELEVDNDSSCVGIRRE